MDYVMASLTAVLALTTLYYAAQSRKQAQEMLKARLLATRNSQPRIAMAFHQVGGPGAFLYIQNVGQGVALNCDLTLTFKNSPVNDAGPSGHNSTNRHLSFRVLDSGERQFLFPPPEVSEPTLEDLLPHFSEIRLTGTAEDAHGSRLEVEVPPIDIREYLDSRKEMRLAYPPGTL